MKKVKILFTALCAITVFSCNKEAVNTENSVNPGTAKHQFVQHTYTYENEQYKLVYEFDPAYKIVGCKGDVEKYRELIRRLHQNDELSFLVESIDPATNACNIRVFDSYAKIDAYCNVTNSGNRSCDNMNNIGSSTFCFYRDINMQNEFTALHRGLCSYFQQQWLDDANDQISSLTLANANFIDLYGGSCFSGTMYRTYNNIPNLHTVIVDYFWFTPVYGGDWCSSIKGYGH